MTRQLKIAAAQLGPIQRRDTRAQATRRLVDLLRVAYAAGAKFVIFPELAFTTFFPRWWLDDQEEVDRLYFEDAMPSAETMPLFDEARRLSVGFSIGYAEKAVDANGEIRRFRTCP